jgi:hypothetical protein
MSGLNMKLVLLTFILSVSAPVWAQDPEETQVTMFNLEDRRVDVKKENSWNASVSAMALQYTPGYQMQSAFRFGESFNNERVLTYGTQLEFGKDYYISDSFMMSTKVNGFYSKGEYTNDRQADETLEVSVARLDSSAETYGAGISQTIGYDFESGDFIIRPFVEYGVGYGLASSEVNYKYQLREEASDTLNTEDFNIRLRDNYTYNSLSLGVAFLMNTGFSSYIKLSRVGILDGTSKKSGTEQRITYDGSGNVSGTLLNEVHDNRKSDIFYYCQL